MSSTEITETLPTLAEQNAVRKLWGRALDYDRKRTETCIKLVQAVEALEDKYPKLRLMSGREAEEYYVSSFNISRTYLIKMRNIARMHEALGEDTAKELPAPWTTQQELASKFKDNYDKLTHLVESKAITSDMEAAEVREVIGQVIPQKKKKVNAAPSRTVTPAGHVCTCSVCGSTWNAGAFTPDSLSSMIQAGAYTAPTNRV